jgi:hypothetical protein
MGVKELLAVTEDVRVLGTGTLSINSVTTANADFGTPDDINLAALAAAGTYKPGDRILAVFRATTAGTTDSTTFSVQDAPDNAGSIGTPATAETDGAMTGGASSQTAVVAVRVKSGRPWLRFRATRASGTTDTHLVSVVVLAIGRQA